MRVGFGNPAGEFGTGVGGGAVGTVPVGIGDVGGGGGGVVVVVVCLGGEVVPVGGADCRAGLVPYGRMGGAPSAMGRELSQTR